MIKSKNQNLYFYCFHKFQPFLSFWLFMSLSLIPIHLFKNLSTVHNFLPWSLCNSFRSSIYLFFLISMASLLFFLLSLSLSLSLSSLTRPHEAEERRPATWWQTVSAGIGPYRPFQRSFLPKLARIGTNWRKSENPKKKTDTARTHGQQHCAPHTTSVHIRCGCSGPGAAPVLSRIWHLLDTVTPGVQLHACPWHFRGKFF